MKIEQQYIAPKSTPLHSKAQRSQARPGRLTAINWVCLILLAAFVLTYLWKRL